MRKALLLLPLLLLAACAGYRRNVSLTSEPSIERAFDLLMETAEGRPLVRFLIANPVHFEYSNTAARCAKFALKARRVYLPVELKASDKMLALAVARAAYVYRLYHKSGMDEIIAEEEELSALFQGRLGLDLGLREADFPDAAWAREFRGNHCNYVLEGSDYARFQARKAALSADPACQRPLDTMEGQRAWLEKTRQAINDQTFYRLLYERDMDRVRRGALSMAEANRNDADLRAMPTYEVYRYQRSFYDKQEDIFLRFAKLFGEEVSRDAAWRASAPGLDEAREEFSRCGLPGEGR